MKKFLSSIMGLTMMLSCGGTIEDYVDNNNFVDNTQIVEIDQVETDDSYQDELEDIVDESLDNEVNDEDVLLPNEIGEIVPNKYDPTIIRLYEKFKLKMPENANGLSVSYNNNIIDYANNVEDIELIVGSVDLPKGSKETLIFSAYNQNGKKTKEKDVVAFNDQPYIEHFKSGKESCNLNIEDCIFNVYDTYDNFDNGLKVTKLEYHRYNDDPENNEREISDCNYKSKENKISFDCSYQAMGEKIIFCFKSSYEDEEWCYDIPLIY
jgi:hypothetical protein